MKPVYLTIAGLFSSLAFSQQFNVNADLRARLENRNGYGTLKPFNEKAATFISQRTRITFDYNYNNIKLVASPQNVRTWGDVLTNSKSDTGINFHEAYGEVKINDKFSFKLGRQEIAYDDQRIFGSIDWAMQAKSHDALLFKFSPSIKQIIHLGIAYNANKETNFKENYIPSQYKSLQYAWYNGSFKDLNLSLLVLNNGMSYLSNGEEKIDYSQTFGPRLVFKRNNLSIDGATYLQTGKINANNIMASYFSANINYKFIQAFLAGLGIEYLSGKNQDDTSTDIKSFNPLHGTNHKFNGYMDYFYVGNHINNVGLTDLYINFQYEKDKFSARLTPHYFLSSANIYQLGEKKDNYLGTEIDFTASYKLLENVTIDGGFSQMFATNSMEIIKGGNKNNGNNWAFLSIKINPNLFNTSLKN
ncbi:alginate export family protein [Flavobacterium oreochromis]|uniref:alginate export family protein n=1 Tax=Flavobacterium oreochromis TaxID=2906078 RepID=UPI001CE53D5C|nr:alginate export family protein [Flavobacterium oreochromis]QYS86180.1 alginate export family protein [Flavobacterium oreochromis]